MYSSLGGLFARYYEFKAARSSCRACYPNPEELRLGTIGTSSADPENNFLYYQIALIGDIELYLKRLEWYEAAILLGRMVPPGQDQLSWNQIANRLNKLHINEGYAISLPRQLKFKSNIRRQYIKKIKKEAIDHFTRAGYIIEEFFDSSVRL